MKRSRSWRLVAAAATGLAGVMHIALGFQHSGAGYAGTFFILAGAAQIVLATGLSLGGRLTVALTIPLNAGLILLYLASRMIGIPGIESQLGFEPLGVAVKLLEGSALVAIAAMVRTANGAADGTDQKVALGEPQRVDPGPREADPPWGITRRQLLKAGSLGAAGVVGGALVGRVAPGAHAHELEKHLLDPGGHMGNAAQGRIDTSRFDPMAYLREFDYGRTSVLADGRTLREFRVTATDIEIEVAPGVVFPAWAYNNRVPGPTLRATEGDLVRVHFTNAGDHPHTIHFHGFHPADMDGVFEIVGKGETFTYEFVAEPFGLHLYHCHVPPLKKHIHKGLYGVFIVDPKAGRPPADELVMMMNAFDTNLDGENEVYSVNTVAHYYMHNPIKLQKDRLIRAYVVNITEFDLINSMHIHANFFNEYRTGTKLEPDNFTDTIILGQGERSIIEFTYRHTGQFMFHAHVSEFAELGWAGIFEVS